VCDLLSMQGYNTYYIQHKADGSCVPGSVQAGINGSKNSVPAKTNAVISNGMISLEFDLDTGESSRSPLHSASSILC
jgi:hypothetical protein